MSPNADPNPFAGPFAHVLSATRLHFPESESSIPAKTEEHLRSYVASVRRIRVPAAIAVKSHAEEVQRICNEVAPDFHICVLHVPCWGAFVPALNALLRYATAGHHCLVSGVHHSFKYILYQSLETICEQNILQLLLDHSDSRTLVVGPVLNGHDFEEGEQVLNGRTTPWNTLALWNVRMLSSTGFLQIAEGLPEIVSADDFPEVDSSKSGEVLKRSTSKKCALPSTNVPAGVEEVTAIALLQNLRGPDRARAFLLKLPREMEEKMSWAADWGDDERRRKWHEEKMQSKVSRPKRQLQELFRQKTPEAPVGTPSARHDEAQLEMLGTVQHINLAGAGPSELDAEDSTSILKTKIKQAAFANRFEELSTLLQQLRSIEDDGEWRRFGA